MISDLGEEVPEHDDDLDEPTDLSRTQQRRRRRRLLERHQYGRVTKPKRRARTVRMTTDQGAGLRVTATTDEGEPGTTASLPVTPRLETWKPDPQFTSTSVVDEEKAWADTNRPYCLFSGAKDPLSNFWMCELELRDHTFRSAEHAYQCFKAWAAEDVGNARAIQAAETASRAKAMGKHVVFNTEQQSTEWDNNKVGVMKEILSTKYQQCEEFSKFLTPGKIYVEGTLDPFWGAGSSVGKLTVQGPPWQGRNVMGALLTTLANEKSLAETAVQHLPKKLIP